MEHWRPELTTSGSDEALEVPDGAGSQNRASGILGWYPKGASALGPISRLWHPISGYCIYAISRYWIWLSRYWDQCRCTLKGSDGASGG